MLRDDKVNDRLVKDKSDKEEEGIKECIGNGRRTRSAAVKSIVRIVDVVVVVIAEGIVVLYCFTNDIPRCSLAIQCWSLMVSRT